MEMKEYTRSPQPPLGAVALGSLDEIWADLPPLPEIQEWLVKNGIWDDKLSEEKIKERYVRFVGINFGVAPVSEHNNMR